MLSFRRSAPSPSARTGPLTPTSRGMLKRRIVLHVLRAPHGEIAVAVDETNSCGHRRTR